MREQHSTAPASTMLHPFVPAAIIGLAVWFVLSVWGFAGSGQTNYLLTVVSGFVLVAVAIPCILWRMAIKRPRDGSVNGEQAKSFSVWASDDFDTGQDRVRGRNAAIEILLPIAAVAFGMTAFAIVLHFTAPAVL